MALEAVKGGGDGGPLATRYQIRPSQIQAWKNTLTEGASGVFSNGQDQKGRSDATLIARLYQEIGQFQGGAGFLVRKVRATSLSQRRKSYAAPFIVVLMLPFNEFRVPVSSQRWFCLPST